MSLVAPPPPPGHAAPPPPSAAPHPAPPRPTGWRHPTLAMLVGVAAAVLALLPWMLAGLRLPLQNLWATQTLPGDMPIALWPMNQYLLQLMFAIAGVAGGTAGVVVRLLRGGRAAGWFAALGVAIGLGVAVTQASAVTAAGMQRDVLGTAYLVLVIGASMVFAVCGALLARLLVGRRGVAVVAATLAAIAAGSWLSAVVLPHGVVMPSPIQGALLLATPWVPAVLVGVALAWCGLQPRTTAAWLVSLAVLYALPGMFTAVGTAIGYRVYWGSPGELVRILGEMLVATLGTGAIGYAVPNVLIAVVVGLLGMSVLRIVRSRRASAA